MSTGGRRFRTTDGVVTVRDDAITMRSPPGQFLSGQSARWRHGSRAERLKTAVVVGGFVASIVAFCMHIYLIADTGVEMASVFYATSVGLFGYSFWRRHVRTATIARSAIQSVTLDAAAREVTVTHRRGDGPLAAFREAVTDTTLPLATDDDLRTARETLQLQGIQVDAAPDTAATEITHRIVTADGGHYCQRCDALVTPNDKVCPTCAYALWVESSPAT